MKESFVQYVWNKQLFDTLELQTEQGETVKVVSPGTWSTQAGPDFFNAKLEINHQLWAGNVEVHLKSSDWYAHHHEKDPKYNNVILHVVWEYDTPVFNSPGRELATLVISKFVRKDILARSTQLFSPKSTINCQGSIGKFTHEIEWIKWKETLYFERLEMKVKAIQLLLEETNNNWVQVLFCFIAKSYGLNSNGEVFYQIAKSLPIQVVLKEGEKLEVIEALLFGLAGLLADEAINRDFYYKEQKKLWDFYKYKYNLTERSKTELQFFKLRPINFPTIRLSQLANWLYNNKYKLNELLIVSDKEMLMSLLKSEVGSYWQTHYTFTKESKKVAKSLSSSFRELLLLNTIIPIQYTYAISKGLHDKVECIVELASQLSAEENTIIELFKGEGVAVNNAFDSQALLQLKKMYCTNNKCLSCMIGTSLLRKN